MLEQLLPAQVFAVFLVFARIGSAFAVLPGFSEAFIAMRFRLMLAGMTSFVVAPVVAPGLPPAPEAPLGLMLLVGGEALIGIFLGMTARLAMAAVQTAGMIIGMQTSLANAFAYDPTTAQQNAVVVLENLTDKTVVGRRAVKLAPGKNRVSLDFVVNRPRLWWPNGLGAQPLYDFRAARRRGPRG